MPWHRWSVLISSQIRDHTKRALSFFDSDAHNAAAHNADSAPLLPKIFCLRVYDLNTRLPSRTTPALDDQPAQSESEYVVLFFNHTLQASELLHLSRHALLVCTELPCARTEIFHVHVDMSGIVLIHNSCLLSAHS